MYISQNPFFSQLDSARTVALRIEEICTQANFPKSDLYHYSHQGITTTYTPKNSEGFFIKNSIRFEGDISSNEFSIEYIYCDFQIFEITCRSKMNQWEIHFSKPDHENNGKCSRQQELVAQKILKHINIYPNDELRFFVSEAIVWSYIEKLLALAKELNTEPYKLTPVQPCAHRWQHHCNWCTSNSGHVGPNMFEAYIACDFCPKKIECEHQWQYTCERCHNDGSTGLVEHHTTTLLCKKCNKHLPITCGVDEHLLPVMKENNIGYLGALLLIQNLLKDSPCKHPEINDVITINEATNTATIHRTCLTCNDKNIPQYILWGSPIIQKHTPPTFTTK